MELIITLLIWALPVTAGFLVGRTIEKRHYSSIIEREKALLQLPTTDLRVPLGRGEVARSELVSGSVVISVDQFKRALATLRGLVGGTVAPYETLLDRAKREAVLRMKASCKGADEIINLRLQTCSLAKNKVGGIGSVEVLAYGTAIYFARTDAKVSS